MPVLATPVADDALAILVVEDNDMVRVITTQVLTTAGYAVLTAADGIEALEILEHTPVPIVLADLRMPRMDGHALARAVTARWPTVRMLFMTGFSDGNATDTLPGPTLLKPFRPDALTTLVRSLAGPRDH